MAELTTTVIGADGTPLHALHGRMPEHVALQAAEGYLIMQRDRAEKALQTLSGWSVRTHRGSERAKSFEELSEPHGGEL